MEKLREFKKEITVIIYYILFLTAIFTVDSFIPGGVHGPGFSFVLFMFFALASAIYFAAQLLMSTKKYGKCLLIHLTVWLALFIWIKFQFFSNDY